MENIKYWGKKIQKCIILEVCHSKIPSLLAVSGNSFVDAENNFSAAENNFSAAVNVV